MRGSIAKCSLPKMSARSSQAKAFLQKMSIRTPIAGALIGFSSTPNINFNGVLIALKDARPHKETILWECSIGRIIDLLVRLAKV